MSFLNIPFSTIPVETGYDPDTEDFPLNQPTTPLDLVGPPDTDRQHRTADKRDLTLRSKINDVLATLNDLLAGASEGTAKIILRDGTLPMTGNLDLGNFAIHNLLDPTSAQDSASKHYVDQQDLLQLPRDGTRAMTGNLDAGNHLVINLNTPSNPGDASNKQYVDSVIGLQMPRDGSRAATASMNMGAFTITNMADPVNAQDGVTVHYLNVALGAYVPIAGNASTPMTGVLNLGSQRITNVSNPAADGDAINQATLNAQISLQLPRDGSRPATGNIDFGTHKGINLVDPTSNQDASTKHYTDQQDALQLPRDGSRPMTGILGAGGFRITGVGAPSTTPSDPAYDDSAAVPVNFLRSVNGGRLYLVRPAAVVTNAVTVSGVTSDNTFRGGSLTIPVATTVGWISATIDLEITDSSTPHYFNHAKVNLVVEADVDVPSRIIAHASVRLYDTATNTFDSSTDAPGGPTFLPVPTAGGAPTSPVTIAVHRAAFGDLRMSIYYVNSTTLQVIFFLYKNSSDSQPTYEVRGTAQLMSFRRAPGSIANMAARFNGIM